MKDKETPLKLVRLWPKLQPGIYEQLDYLRDAKTDGEVWWPDYCPLPISAAFTYLSNTMTADRAAAVAAELTACWIWRQNKVIYKFDGELASALMEQVKDIQDTEELPVDLLLHLPYPCIYIKCPTILDHVDGFFAWIEWDVKRKAAELRIQIVLEDFTGSIPMVMHLIPGGSIKDCIIDTLKTTAENIKQPVPLENSSFRIILCAVQMLLYLAAENADVLDVPPALKRAEGQVENRNVIRVIRDKAGEIAEKDVGLRIGATIRRANKRRATQEEADVTGATKRPHARRGHWHHYWTGPKDGERKLILKWTAPTFIHPEDGMDDGVVMFKVK